MLEFIKMEKLHFTNLKDKKVLFQLDFISKNSYIQKIYKCN